MSRITSLLVSAGLIASSLLPATSVSAATVGVGDEVAVAFICKTKDSLLKQLDAARARGGEAANERLKADLKAGECVVLPEEALVLVEEVLPVQKFELEGVVMEFQVVRVRGVWAVVMSKAVADRLPGA